MATQTEGFLMTEQQRKAAHDLKRFLEHREADIALDIDDFGDLAITFEQIMGRRAIAPKVKVNG